MRASSAAARRRAGIRVGVSVPSLCRSRGWRDHPGRDLIGARQLVAAIMHRFDGAAAWQINEATDAVWHGASKVDRSSSCITLSQRSRDTAYFRLYVWLHCNLESRAHLMQEDANRVLSCSNTMARVPPLLRARLPRRQHRHRHRHRLRRQTRYRCFASNERAEADCTRASM